MHHAPRTTMFLTLAALVGCLGLAALGAAFGAPPHFVELAAAGSMLFGTVTVTYLKPATGTVAPTAAQVSPSTLNTVVAQLVCADADTTATITHNLNVSAADQLLGFPRITAYLSGAGTFPVMLAFANLTNTITVTKPSTAAGSNATWVVIIDRPHSFIR
jgi:hypothetical protein